MDLDTITIRVLAAIERARDDNILADEAVIGVNPMTSDGSPCDPPTDLTASRVQLR